MAFCNSCGNSLAAGAKFCAKCGAPAPGIAPSAAISPPLGPPTTQSSSGTRTVLIIVGVLAALFILGTAMAVFVGWRIARHTHVEQNGDNVRVVSPFGSVESTNDSTDISRELGSVMYPGSSMKKGSASSVRIGSMRTVAANFETDDPVSKVAAFYRAKFPDANVSTGNDDNYTIVSSANHGVITITVEPEGSRTAIHLASMSGKRN